MGDRDENVTWNHSANILIDVGELIAAGQLTGLLPGAGKWVKGQY